MLTSARVPAALIEIRNPSKSFCDEMVVAVTPSDRREAMGTRVLLRWG